MSVLLACGLLSGVITAWWQIGIRVGQRLERQTVLFEPATDTRFWDRVVIEPPFALLAFGFLGIVVWCGLMIHQKRWGPGALIGLGVGFFLMFGTMCLNLPLVDEASP